MGTISSIFGKEISISALRDGDYCLTIVNQKTKGKSLTFLSDADLRNLKNLINEVIDPNLSS